MPKSILTITATAIIISDVVEYSGNSGVIIFFIASINAVTPAYNTITAIIIAAAVIAITGICLKVGYFEVSRPDIGYVFLIIGLVITAWYLRKLKG